MSKIFLSLLCVLILCSCKKNKNDQPGQPQYLVFGISGGFCGSCYHYYKLENGAIYKDSNHISQLNFYSTPMPDSNYQLANQLLNNFPNYLVQHPNTDYGCNGCADQLVFYIETKQNGVITKWRIDDVENVQPNDIKPYIQQLNTIMGQLK